MRYCLKFTAFGYALSVNIVNEIRESIVYLIEIRGSTWGYLTILMSENAELQNVFVVISAGTEKKHCSKYICYNRTNV